MRWRRPARAYDYYWRTEGLPFARQFWFLWLRWWLILATPSIGLALLVDSPSRMHLGAVYLLMLLLPILGLGLIHIEPLLKKKWPTEYRLDGNGISTAVDTFSWKQIEAATIEDHPELEGVRRLSIKIRGYRFLKSMDFDPGEVDEGSLSEVLAEQLQSRLLLRAASSDPSVSLLRASTAVEQSDPATLLRSAGKESCAHR